MSGSKILLDTNIIVYFLNGDDTLTTFLDGKIPYVSFITKLELLSYSAITKKEEDKISRFLNDCIIIHTNTDIENNVIRLRKKYKVKLPDSIIMATALYHDLPLITADKDFEKVEELNVISYSQT